MSKNKRDKRDSEVVNINRKPGVSLKTITSQGMERPRA